jgi:hypothetical protein
LGDNEKIQNDRNKGRNPFRTFPVAVPAAGAPQKAPNDGSGFETTSGEVGKWSTLKPGVIGAAAGNA